MSPSSVKAADATAESSGSQRDTGSQRKSLTAPQIPHRRLESTLAFLAYFAASIFLFGSEVIAAPLRVYVGEYTDPSAFIWDLAWWPHAIAHRLNPFLPKVVWAPDGFNLASAASIPGPALILSPLTYAFGPVASYNLLVLTAPAIGAWAAFLLCRYASNHFWPSLVGGYVFGFSPYELGHMLGHANLVIIAGPPIVVYLFLLRLNHRLTSRPFYILLASTLILQFLTSTEIFMTLTLFGGSALLIAFWLLKERRRDLASMAPPIVFAYLTVLALLAPYLYYTFASGAVTSTINSPFEYSIDVANFLIPVRAWLGSSSFASFSAQFHGAASENTGYLGLPLLATIVAFVFTKRRNPAFKLLNLELIIVVLLSLGPLLKVCGRTMPAILPWALALRVPLIDQALPARFTLYMFLICAIMVSLCLEAVGSTVLQVLWGALIVISLFPRLPWPNSRVDTPHFFVTDKYKKYLNRDDIVLVLPFGWAGNSMTWQAHTRMYFRMAGGYVGRTPSAARLWPIVPALLAAADIPEGPQQLKAFIRDRGISAVVVAYQGRRVWNGSATNSRTIEWDWPALLSPLGVAPLKVDDVWIYRIAPDLRRTYPKSSAAEMTALTAGIEFKTLVTAACKYLSLFHDSTDGLTLLKARDLGLVPASWLSLADPGNPAAANEVALYAHRNDIVVAVRGVAEGLRAIYEHYRSSALRSEFVAGSSWYVAPPSDGASIGYLVMTFDRTGIRRAAACDTDFRVRGNGTDGSTTENSQVTRSAR